MSLNIPRVNRIIRILNILAGISLLAAIFATFIGLYVYRVQTRGQAFTYSVDFTGGTQILFKFSTPIGSEKLKNE